MIGLADALSLTVSTAPAGGARGPPAEVPEPGRLRVGQRPLGMYLAVYGVRNFCFFPWLGWWLWTCMCGMGGGFFFFLSCPCWRQGGLVGGGGGEHRKG